MNPEDKISELQTLPANLGERQMEDKPHWKFIFFMGIHGGDA